jgi:hypothetical protein
MYSIFYSSNGRDWTKVPYVYNSVEAAASSVAVFARKQTFCSGFVCWMIRDNALGAP